MGACRAGTVMPLTVREMTGRGDGDGRGRDRTRDERERERVDPDVCGHRTDTQVSGAHGRAGGAPERGSGFLALLVPLWEEEEE